MIIKAKRIRNPAPYLAQLNADSGFAVGISDISRFERVLRKIGFTKKLERGETVLPAPLFGPVSRFNAEGKYEIHKDQPKETAYRMVEWHWTEWHGQERVEQTDFREVPYERYPRTFIPPPGVELTISQGADGEKIVVGPMMKNSSRARRKITHVINVMLELFGECQFFAGDLSKIVTAKLRRLNWRILPPGKMPWSQLRSELEPLIARAPKGNQPVISHRLATINKHRPDFAAVGQAGFHGYVVLGFTVKQLYVLESMYYGNATYVFDKDWKDLSKRTKAEIIAGNLQRERLVHRKGWENQVNRLLRN